MCVSIRSTRDTGWAYADGFSRPLTRVSCSCNVNAPFMGSSRRTRPLPDRGRCSFRWPAGAGASPCSWSSGTVGDRWDLRAAPELRKLRVHPLPELCGFEIVHRERAVLEEASEHGAARMAAPMGEIIAVVLEEQVGEML